MKNYSKACQWDKQMKSIMNLNAVMYYNLLLFTGPFSYINDFFFFFFNREGKSKFKELLNSLS